MNAIGIYKIIRGVAMTEKAFALQEREKYTFLIEKDATKSSISEAVEKIFLVKVKKINILNVKGKRVFKRGRWGKTSDRKKAIVTLQEGQKIDFGIMGV